MNREMTRTETAADLAGVAGLLQIAVELGVSQFLDHGEPFSVADLATGAETPEAGMACYVEALLAAGLVQRTDVPGQFRAAPDYPERQYEAGYLSWALNANNPFIEHVHEFLRDQAGAAREYRRDGRRVAVSSRWMGTLGVYPWVFERIMDAGARRIADLGAGAAGLLIDLLRAVPSGTGIALDISPDACAEARRAAARAGVANRLQVVERSIQSLAADPGPIEGADVIHAGFVFHDVIQDEAVYAEMLRSCRAALAPGGFMAINDVVPYVPEERERRFSALFSYLHAGFMNVRLPTEKEWLEKFYNAGFSQVECVP